LIKNIFKIKLIVLFLVFFFKFYRNISLNFFSKKKIFFKINSKKNLFFKKKNSQLNLVSKRLQIVLKKRKKLKQFKFKKIDRGNFFFKKFFFKTLLKSRKFLKYFFFLNKGVRQKKITKSIFQSQKNLFSNKSYSYEYTLLNILLRSHIFFFFKDLMSFIRTGYIYINNIPTLNYNTIIREGDCVQLPIFKKVYKYIQFSKKILKKKTALYKYTSWKFFKQKFFKKKKQLKFKKRKTPKYLYLFYLFRLNVPRYLEIDYMTLTIFFLKKQNVFIQTSYYLNKLFSFKLFSLYNFKKIN
jgi:hypothetical protein